MSLIIPHRINLLRDCLDDYNTDALCISGSEILVIQVALLCLDLMLTVAKKF